MKALLVQTDIKLGGKRHNLNRAVKVIKDNPADLYLFPELFTTGFDYGGIPKLAEELPGETVEKIAGACSGAIVGGSMLERHDEKFFNTFVLISEEGLLGSYRKIHPFRSEGNHLSPGEDARMVETRLGKIGLAVCYDIRFPELFRSLMRFGAEIVLVSAEFPRPRQMHWRTLLRARAIENQFFVLAANRVGSDDEEEYFGGSLAIDPWGEILVEGDGLEEIIGVELDLSLVQKMRRRFPVLRDIRL